MKSYLPVVGTCLIFVLSAHSLAANPPATDVELQQLFDKKMYAACLQQSARILALRGDAAKPYDLYVINMRRGECYLNVNDMATAGIAFSAALSAAATPEKADEARAIIALIKASRGPNYTSKGASLNIVALPTRQEAYRALYADKFAAAGPAIDAATQATTLAPIIQFVPQAHDLHALEIKSTGSDAQTRPILMAIGEKARSIINNELIAMHTNLDGISGRANQVLASSFTTIASNDGGLVVTDTRQGLFADDRATLRNMIPYLSDIANVCVDAKQTAIAFGADGQVWDPVIADSQAVLRRAQAVLDAD